MLHFFSAIHLKKKKKLAYCNYPCFELSIPNIFNKEWQITKERKKCRIKKLTKKLSNIRTVFI